MFSKLKEKLRGIAQKLSKKAEEEEVIIEEEKEERIGEKIEEEQEEIKEESKEKKKEEKKEKEEKEEIEKKELLGEKQEEGKEGEEKRKVEEREGEEKTEREEERREKKGLFKRIIKKQVISEKAFEEVFQELELEMLEANVALEVVEKIKNDLKSSIVGREFRKGELETVIIEELRKSIEEILNQGYIDILKLSNEKKPLVIAFFGINGTGKTTTIAKIAKMFLDNGKKVVIAAADTYRAASIEQLEEHANRLGVRVIKHDYGADPAAVAFDAVQHAKAKNIDIVLIDTAGRMHSNKNLMEELRKIVRVVKPDLKVLVAESITGNDSIIQAEMFDRGVGIDAVILTKVDVDEKGGTALSITYTIKKPIIFLGVGQEYKDLKRFDPREISNTILGVEKDAKKK
ncbi:signal recognition particle-docking protein FtsY [Candidatus Woesearchaeota archaeon]|nr:signal recognition particle-docking protein FtsY [Candidatus Woesearchaeota archaeon]